jgi:hypothetical protein
MVFVSVYKLSIRIFPPLYFSTSPSPMPVFAFSPVIPAFSVNCELLVHTFPVSLVFTSTYELGTGGGVSPLSHSTEPAMTKKNKSRATNEVSRCLHRFPNGKRCRLALSDKSSSYCNRHSHLAEPDELQLDFSSELMEREPQRGDTIFAPGSAFDRPRGARYPNSSHSMQSAMTLTTAHAPRQINDRKSHFVDFGLMAPR